MAISIDVGSSQSTQATLNQPRASLRRLLVLMAGISVGSVSLGHGLPAQAQVMDSARITEILDSNQVYIQNQPAQVNALANRGQQVRTGQARAELRFNTGAVGRLTQNSSLTLGSTCVRLSRGQLLVSGGGTSCTPTVIAGVRGTVYTLAVSEAGVSEITVLEGRIEVLLTDHTLTQQTDLNQRWQTQPLAGANNLPLCQLSQTQAGLKAVSCGPIPLQAGLRLVVDANGQLQTIQPLSPEDFEATISGPFWADFSQLLPGQDKLQDSFQQLYPEAEFPGFPALPPATGASETLDPVCQGTVDRYRQQIRTLVEVAWEPPSPPAPGLWQTFLTYDVTRNGQVQNVLVQQSSGYAPFDDSAVGSAQQTIFPPLPDCFPEEALGITHRFELRYE